MQSNTAVKVHSRKPEESCSENRLGAGTMMVSLLLMTVVFSIVWFGVFNPFMGGF